MGPDQKAMDETCKAVAVEEEVEIKECIQAMVGTGAFY